MPSQQDNKNGAYFDNDGRQPLLNLNNGDAADKNNESSSNKDAGEKKQGGCYRLNRCMGWTVSREKRYIELNGKTTPRSFPSNTINN